MFDVKIGELIFDRKDSCHMTFFEPQNSFESVIYSCFTYSSNTGFRFQLGTRHSVSKATNCKQSHRSQVTF